MNGTVGASYRTDLPKKLHQYIRNLIFMSLNCRSLRSKTFDLELLIFEEKLDVIMLQETWLTKADKSIYAEFIELG